MEWQTSAIQAVWLTAPILVGGFARTRNRSAWTWFLLTVVLGPIAAFLLVVWPARNSTATAATVGGDSEG